MKNNTRTPLKNRLLWILLLVLGIATTGLIGIIFYGHWPLKQESAPVVVDASEISLVDCIWTGRGLAWIDENKNGAKDENEQPLSNVNIYIDDVLNGFTKVGGSPGTDWKGETEIGVFLAGCPNTTLEVYPEVPAGFKLTTKPRLRTDSTIQDQVFEFGFIYLADIPTITPVPPKPVCESYRLGEVGKNELGDLAISPNGTVWVAGNGVYQLRPNSTEWTYFDHRGISAIAIENDDSIWFGTYRGVSHFDGRTWTSHTATDELTGYAVTTSIVIDKPLIWLGTTEGVLLHDLNTQSWKKFSTNDGLADDLVESATISQDGSIWFSTFSGFSRLIWPSRPSGSPEWITYTYNGSQNRHVEARPEGTIWVGGFSGISIFDLKSSAWKSLDLPFYVDVVNTFAFGKDSSLWIGSGRNNKIFHRVNDQHSTQEIWRSYDSRDGLPVEIDGDDKINAIAFAPDGSVWIGTRENATRCVFPEE
jgi:streptogramin lyase